MATRQGDTYTTTKSGVTEPDSITVSLEDPSGDTVVNNATPTLDVDTGDYSYTYTFPVDADLGNWKFTWNVDSTPTDDIVNLQAKLTAVYAEHARVIELTNEVKEGLHDDNKYENLLVRGLGYSDRKINSKLRKNNITTPAITDEDLTEAGNLYAAYLIFNTYYSSNDRTSPAAAAYKTDADEFLLAYIETVNRTGDGEPYTHRNTSMDWYDTRRRP